MTFPKISVVIPTYNRPSKLKRAVESVNKQDYDPIELLIINGSSTPIKQKIDDFNTNNICDIHIICQKDSTGVSSARNMGIKAATGKYIAFLDDDDEWYPNKIKRQWKVIENSNSDIGIVYSSVRNVDQNGKFISSNEAVIEGDITKDLLCQNCIGTFSSVFVETSAARAVDGLDERLPIWEDWDFFIRLSLNVKFRAITDTLVTRYSGDHNQITDNFEANRDISFPIFVEKYRPIAAEYGPVFERKVMGHLHYRLGYRAVSTGYYDEARSNFLRAVHWYPFSLPFYVYLLAALGGARTYKPMQRLRRWITQRFDNI